MRSWHSSPSLPWPRAVLFCLCLFEGSCSCNQPAPEPCPAAFSVGELCPAEGLVCVWPESRCGKTLCTCENEVGGFFWKCKPPGWCSCTCWCGYTAAVSCESLECQSQPQDPCPPTVADSCELACTLPDAGPGPEAGPDASRRDGPPDTGGDGPPDRAADRAIDQRLDRLADQPSGGQDRGASAE